MRLTDSAIGYVPPPPRRARRVRYCRLLEEGPSFRGRSADFFTMILFGASLMLLIAPFRPDAPRRRAPLHLFSLTLVIVFLGRFTLSCGCVRAFSGSGASCAPGVAGVGCVG